MALGVGAVRGGGEGSAVDGGATRCVCNHHMVSEELGDVLDVRGFTATCAGAAVLKQRLGKLGVLHIGLLVHILLVAHELVEIVEVCLLCGIVNVRYHLEGLFGLGKTYVNAVAAACAVVNGDGDGVLVILEVGLALGKLETCGNLCCFFFGEERFVNPLPVMIYSGSVNCMTDLMSNYATENSKFFFIVWFSLS